MANNGTLQDIMPFFHGGTIKSIEVDHDGHAYFHIETIGSEMQASICLYANGGWKLITSSGKPLSDPECHTHEYCVADSQGKWIY
jgi:hypothetical protein